MITLVNSTFHLHYFALKVFFRCRTLEETADDQEYSLPEPFFCKFQQQNSMDSQKF